MSNINPQNIDGTFPIAGQDNNSQGFRDNFTNTINNFTFAAAELADLQTYAVVTGPLTSVGQTGTPTNNMNYTYLTKPQLLGAVETSKNIGNIASSGTIQVDWSQGHYQTVGATGSVGLSFTSTWPTTSLYTKLRLQIKAWGTTTIALDTTARPVNINSIQGVSANVLTLSDGLYAFEFSTSDAGATLSIVDLWRNYDTATQFDSLSVAGNILSTGLTVFGNMASTATHVETGYQQVKPTANVAVTVSHNVNRVLIHPTGTIVSFGANVTLPNVQVNGTIINISSNVTISGLDVRSGYNGVVAVSPFGNATVTAGSNTRYMYIAADSTWYKIA